MRLPYALLTVQLAFVINPTRAEQTAAAAVTSLCTEVEYNKQLKFHFANALITAEQAVRDLSDEATTLRLALAAEKSAARATALAALEALAISRRTKTVMELQAGKAEYVSLLEALDARIGQLKAALRFRPTAAPAKKSATPKTGQSTFGGVDTLHCTITLEDAKSRDYECDSTLENTQALKKAAAQLQTATSINLIKDEHFTYKNLKITAMGKGTGNSATTQATANKDCADTDTTRTSYTAGVGIDLAFEPEGTIHTSVQLYKNGNIADGCAASDEHEHKTLITKKKLAHVLCKAMQKSLKPAKRVKDETPITLADDETMQKIAIALQPNKYKEGVEVTDKECAVKAIFGTGTETIQTKYFQPLTTTELKYKIGTAEHKQCRSVRNKPRYRT
uniref:Variant surface glycoprotein 1125.1361 n=1 Tax=Trypanosoma brucei TaxID=5691 RepID=A0A1J0R6T6_9TRYP|nr:variant surface glycoprotein 1125.1361 [Trypanosoma brucei]